MDQFFAPLVSEMRRAVASICDLNFKSFLEDFPNGLWKAVIELDPLAVVLLVLALVMLYAYLGSIVTGDYSFVDRQWSIVPGVYTAIFALHPSSANGGGDPQQARLLLMSGLVSLWCIRMTYNFWRRGGYSGMEDYRWLELRSRMNAVGFQVFNLLFIASFQPILLVLITLPALLSRRMNTPLTTLDYVATGMFLFFLTLETVADEQQWTFQNQKQAAKARGKPLRGDYARGFRTTGLFRYSRHPNFFAEQCIWISFYLFSVAATGDWLNYSSVGVTLLMTLFQGSTTFTETLSVRRHPLYKEYQKVTSRLIPLPAMGKVPEKRD